MDISMTEKLSRLAVLMRRRHRLDEEINTLNKQLKETL